ncbi:hypothetical protein KY289_029867 [Solanum tuberosum]|nr:hypothetical protein KY289_029867 [Solanum tuberosum]
MPSTLRAFQIELKTAPADFRFPTTNQTRHCFTRYVEFHRCVAAKGDEAADCERFAKYYRALCPGEWTQVCYISLQGADRSKRRRKKFYCPTTSEISQVYGNTSLSLDKGQTYFKSILSYTPQEVISGTRREASFEVRFESFLRLTCRVFRKDCRGIICLGWKSLVFPEMGDQGAASVNCCG